MIPDSFLFYFLHLIYQQAGWLQNTFGISIMSIPLSLPLPWFKPVIWIILQSPPDFSDSILCHIQSLLRILAKESFWPINRIVPVLCLESSMAPHCPHDKIQIPHPSHSPSLQAPLLTHFTPATLSFLLFLSLGKTCIWMLIPQIFKCHFLLPLSWLFPHFCLISI